LDEQKRRLSERSAGGGSVSDGRVELLEQQIRGFYPPDDSEEAITINSTGRTPEQTLDSVYERLFPL